MIVESLIGVAAALFLYGLLIEAYRLRLTKLEFVLDRLPPEFDGFTILHLSDLHLKKQNWIHKLCNGRLERKMLKLLTGRSFDMVAFTGDAELRGEGFEAMRGILDAVQSYEGVFFTPGNGEYQEYDIDHLLALFSSWGVKTLRNSSSVIERGGGRFYLIGVDDHFTRHSDLEAALRGVPEDQFKLLLSHSPGIAREAIRGGIDLVLSGHTHGGQVRLPFLGAIYTHVGKGAPSLDHGVFEGSRLSSKTGMNAGRTKVFVTRGVGMSNFYIRFLCPPEIAVITLRSASGRYPAPNQ